MAHLFDHDYLFKPKCRLDRLIELWMEIKDLGIGLQVVYELFLGWVLGEAVREGELAELLGEVQF